MFSSIKFKLLLLYLLVSSVTYSFVGSFIYLSLADKIIGSIDTHLHLEVQLLAGFLETDDHDDESVLEIGEASVGEYAIPLSGHYFQIVSDTGEILGRSPSLSIVDTQLPVKGKNISPQYESIIGPDKSSSRMLTQSFIINSSVVTIQASESLEESNQLLYSFQKTLFLIFFGFFIISGIGILLITKSSLKSLLLFSKQISLITAASLGDRVVEEGVDSELRPLAASFNTMLARLEKSFETQKRFLSDASHQLRTPTAVIKSYCDVISSKKREPEEYIEALDKIGETIDKMSDTINKILTVSRLETSTLTLRSDPVNLNEIFTKILNYFENYAIKEKISINLAPKEIGIIGDKEKLTEAFINIIENGIKYNNPGGEINITFERDSKWVITKIEDTGIGIPEIEKEKIFERFYRVKDAENKSKGNGLGLSIAGEIVTSHKGRIEVESKMGEGTRFSIFLPGI